MFDIKSLERQRTNSYTDQRTKKPPGYPLDLSALAATDH